MLMPPLRVDGLGWHVIDQTRRGPRHLAIRSAPGGRREYACTAACDASYARLARKRVLQAAASRERGIAMGTVLGRAAVPPTAVASKAIGVPRNCKFGSDKCVADAADGLCAERVARCQAGWACGLACAEAGPGAAA